MDAGLVDECKGQRGIQNGVQVHRRVMRFRAGSVSSTSIESSKLVRVPPLKRDPRSRLRAAAETADEVLVGVLGSVGGAALVISDTIAACRRFEPRSD